MASLASSLFELYALEICLQSFQANSYRELRYAPMLIENCFIIFGRDLGQVSQPNRFEGSSEELPSASLPVIFLSPFMRLDTKVQHIQKLRFDRGSAVSSDC